MNLNRKIVFLCFLITGVDIFAMLPSTSIQDRRLKENNSMAGFAHDFKSRISQSREVVWKPHWAPKLISDPRIQFSSVADKNNTMKINGDFRVNECTWRVVRCGPSNSSNSITTEYYEDTDLSRNAIVQKNDSIKDWTFVIEIEQLRDGKYWLTVQNPDVSYFGTIFQELVPGKTWTCECDEKKLRDKKELVDYVASLILDLHPLNPGYGE